MGLYLGIDTSNYTTSAALFDSSNQTVSHNRRLLPVREGELGLRQNEAVFAHVKQLPEVIAPLLDGQLYRFDAVGCSARPRDVDGSYMPCFLVGEMLAQVLAGQCGAPLDRWSHQAGHVVAALYAAGRLDLIRKPFLAFHYSGGTTEGLLVQPDRDRVLQIEQISGTLDLNAGQVVDRVGAMLGLAFPAGKALEKLAEECGTSFSVRIHLKGMNCCLSGVENQCRDMLAKGTPPSAVAKYCLDYLCGTVLAMTQAALLEYGDLPCVYAGGVTSNAMVRSAVSEWQEGIFASPELSSDNAVGTAVLSALHAQRGSL